MKQQKLVHEVEGKKRLHDREGKGSERSRGDCSGFSGSSS